jgi:hypothetical protein
MPNVYPTPTWDKAKSNRRYYSNFRMLKFIVSLSIGCSILTFFTFTPTVDSNRKVLLGVVGILIIFTLLYWTMFYDVTTTGYRITRIAPIIVSSILMLIIARLEKTNGFQTVDGRSLLYYSIGYVAIPFVVIFMAMLHNPHPNDQKYIYPN